MKKENNNIDDFLKDVFDNFEVNPNKQNWGKISDQLDSRAASEIKRKFDQYEVAPPSSNWDKIKDQLPYNLRIRRQLSRLAKIAAVLLVGMLFTVSSNIWKNQAAIAQNEAAVKEPTTPSIDLRNSSQAELIIDLEEDVNFVFDLDDENQSSKDNEKEEEEDIMALLDFILDDSDALETLIDQSIVEASLSPVEELPMEGLVLVVPENDVEEVTPAGGAAAELTIKIPLVVVEESEIESLINMYDANVTHGTNSDN